MTFLQKKNIIAIEYKKDSIIRKKNKNNRIILFFCSSKARDY